MSAEGAAPLIQAKVLMMLLDLAEGRSVELVFEDQRGAMEVIRGLFSVVVHLIDGLAEAAGKTSAEVMTTTVMSLMAERR